MMAAVALYHCDYTPTPWVPVAAASRDQAEILAQQAYAIIRQSPGMNWTKETPDGRFRVFEGYRKITSMRNGGRGIKVYAADAHCLPVDEPVLTPTGWTPIGDLRVGDEICDPDGGTCLVEGVYPRGHEDVYRVTLADGSSVRATEDHLWTVGISQRRPYWRTITTAQVGRYLALDEPLRQNTRWGQGATSRARRTRLCMPMIAPQEFASTPEPPVDPYLLGMLLGDGSLGRTPVRLTSIDLELVDAAESVLPSGVYLHQDGELDDPDRAPSWSFSGLKTQAGDGQFVQGSNPLTESLRDLGLVGSSAETKFIPESYKWASIGDRLAIVQGMMDTDGTIDEKGRSSYTSISSTLIKDLQFIIRSLGGRASLGKPYLPSRGGGGRVKDGYKRSPVHKLNNIQLPGMSLFRLKRKVDRKRDRTFHARQWSVVSVEPAGHADVVCIKVSSPSHLYITRDFIPTHNTGDGVIPTLAMCDEGHRWPDLAVYRLWKGKLNKRGGQIVMISTAGEPGGEFEETRDAIRDQAKKTTVNGAHIRSEGPSIIMNEWRVEREEWVSDMVKVKEANPFSGITVQTLADDFQSPTTDLGDWKRLKCNIPSRTVNAAITEVEWANAHKGAPTQIPAGERISAGVDVAWKHDTFAIAPMWNNTDDEYLLLGAPIILTPPRDGSTMHPDEAKMAFEALNDVNPIDTVVIDLERAEDIAAWLEDEMGITVIDRPQGNANAIQDYDVFMKRLRNGTLKHTGDAGLHRHVMNAIARSMPGDKRRFDRPSQSRARKRQQVRVIDALTAAAMVVQYGDEFSVSEPLLAWR